MAPTKGSFSSSGNSAGTIPTVRMLLIYLPVRSFLSHKKVGTYGKFVCLLSLLRLLVIPLRDKISKRSEVLQESFLHNMSLRSKKTSIRSSKMVWHISVLLTAGASNMNWCSIQEANSGTLWDWNSRPKNSVDFSWPSDVGEQKAHGLLDRGGVQGLSQITSPQHSWRSLGLQIFPELVVSIATRQCDLKQLVASCKGGQSGQRLLASTRTPSPKQNGRFMRSCWLQSWRFVANFDVINGMGFNGGYKAMRIYKDHHNFNDSIVTALKNMQPKHRCRPLQSARPCRAWGEWCGASEASGPGSWQKFEHFVAIAGCWR